MQHFAAANHVLPADWKTFLYLYMRQHLSTQSPNNRERRHEPAGREGYLSVIRLISVLRRDGSLVQEKRLMLQSGDTIRK